MGVSRRKSATSPAYQKDGNKMKQFTRRSQAGGEKWDKRANVSVREASADVECILCLFSVPEFDCGN